MQGISGNTDALVYLDHTMKYEDMHLCHMIMTCCLYIQPISFVCAVDAVANVYNVQVWICFVMNKVLFSYRLHAVFSWITSGPSILPQLTPKYPNPTNPLRRGLKHSPE